MNTYSIIARQSSRLVWHTVLTVYARYLDTRVSLVDYLYTFSSEVHSIFGGVGYMRGCH